MKRSGWSLSSAALMGGFLGSACTIIMVLVLRPQGLQSWAQFSDGLSLNYGPNFWPAAQTLVALFAAVVAYVVVRYQIQTQKDADEQRRLARLEGERSSLPFALKAISKLCDNRVESLVSGSLEDAPTIEAEFVATLKSCIEYSEGDVRRNIVDLLQILSTCCLADHFVVSSQRYKGVTIAALLRDREEVGEAAKNRLHLILFWVALKARAAEMEDFAVGLESDSRSAEIVSTFNRKVAEITLSGFPVVDMSGFSEVKAEVWKSDPFFLCLPNWRELWSQSLSENKLPPG